MIAVKCRRLALLAVVFCCADWGSTAHADWIACESKPTRSCLLEEALRGDGAPLAGKDRLDVLIQADAINHIEYATAADIEEAQRQAKPTPIALRYGMLAIRGLIAANQKQQAADLVGSFRGPFQDLAFADLARTLAKAGDVDTAAALLDRMAPTLDPTTRIHFEHVRVVESIKALAEAGKIEDALLLMIPLPADFREREVAEMQTAVAQAYARRGDAKTAQRLFDLAAQTVEKARVYTLGSEAELLQFASLTVSAFRGDAEAVRAGLRQMQSQAGGQAPDRYTSYERSQGYQRLVYSLLQAKQFPLALELAKSAPDSVRNMALILVSSVNASNGRIDDALSVLALVGDKMDPTMRAGPVRNVAVALVKSGKLAAAVEMAAQVSDPMGRRTILFAIAQTLPP